MSVLLSSIGSELARQAADKRDYERAIKNYKEAVFYSDNDGKVSAHKLTALSYF